MKKVLLFILFTATIASAQLQRYDSFAATTTSASGIGNITQVIPNATLQVFNYPGAGTNCASGGCVAASTFTSRTGVTPCGGGLPVTRPTSPTCFSTADASGNFGFWAPAGVYQYCVSSTSITTQCFNVALGATLDGNNNSFGLVNAVYNPASCSLTSPTPAPSWCSGAEMGAWVNAAAANCTNVAGACRIHIPSSASCFSFTTPIVFGLGKFITLEGDPGGGSCLKYTPTTGTAITFDPGVSEHHAYGIRDLQLIGPGNGTATVGVQMGVVSGNGAEGFLINGLKTASACCTNDGFGVGVQQGTGSSFISTITNSGIYSNGVGFKQQGVNENTRLIANSISNNTTNAIVMPSSGGTNDLYSQGNSYDGNGNPSISMPGNATGGGNIFESIGDHYENPPSNAAAANGYISLATNSSLTIIGGIMLDDRTTSTNTNGLIQCSGNSYVTVIGLARFNGGINVNPFIALSGNCRSMLRMGNASGAGTWTDYTFPYTGAGIDSLSQQGANSQWQFFNAAQGANVWIPFGSNTTTGLVANMGSTQLGPATTATGVYQVCVAMFPTATGTATAIQATVSSNDGNAFTANVGTVLSTAALTNIGGGCTSIPASSGVTISVATTGYSGTGTYTVRSVINEMQ